METDDINHVHSPKEKVNAQEPLSLSINNTCRIMDIGRTTVYELIKQGKLKTTKIGAKTLVLYPSIKEVLHGE